MIPKPKVEILCYFIFSQSEPTCRHVHRESEIHVLDVRPQDQMI